MGARGPGAKPVRRPRGNGAEPAAVADEQVKPWQKPGLSRADRVIRFIESLTLTAGRHAGKPFKLRPWQKRFIRRLYRTDRRGARLVRQALLTCGRKNGKTQLAAALALCHLVGPEAEPRGEVYSSAADRNQAGRCYREMKAMILADEELSARCVIRDFNKQIEDVDTGSTYEALSSDARKAHSLSPSFVVCDELAQWRDRELYDNLVTGTGARDEPLVLVISTKSSDPHHVMTEVVDYARQVRDGVIEDPTFCGEIYEVPADADHWDSATWKLANPALNDFRSLAEMQAFAAKARRLPSLEPVFRNLYCNQAVDADERFIPATEWLACADAVDPDELRGRPCWAGLDLSSTKDLTALVLYFPDDGGAVLPFFWVPGDRLDEREDRDRVPYRTWREQGLIEAPPGRAIDRYAIVRRIAEITAAYDVRGVAYDRWRVEDLVKLLEDEGIELPLTGFGQGYASMGPAVDLLEAAVLNRQLRHGGHQVLTWNVSNAVVSTDPAGARKLDKQRAKERIDGLVALVMAMGLHAREPAPMTYDFSRPLALSA